MATGGTDPLTKLCEDVLSCEICSEEFNWDTQTPRILPCYHCFCETCLSQLTKDGSLQCPKCRTDIQVTGKFPVETTRMALMDKKRALQSQKGVACECCTEGAKATSRCQQCEKFLCESCSADHPSIQASNDHTLVSLDEVAKNVDKLLPRSEKCEHHSDRKLEMFCVTCSTAVCITCIQTLHQVGHKVVEIGEMLDEKKQEMLALCDKLEQMQQSFQAKAEESEASVEAVESNLNEAVHKVERLYSEIISSAIESQGETIENLRARAKSDKLLLGEQSTTFRSLQTAAQQAAQSGRRCVALSLVSQMFSHTTQLSKTIQELSEKTTAEVKPASTYEFQVMTDKLQELKTLMKEIGETGSKYVYSGISLPSIQLDSSRCGPDCWVGEDKCSLSNQPRTHSHSQPPSQRFGFPGTCGTEALPEGSSYWQLKCHVQPKPMIIDKRSLCEFGVATQKAMQQLPGTGWISNTDHCALTARIYLREGFVKVGALYRNQAVCNTDLAPTSPRSPVVVTFGLLLDTAMSCLHVIDVMAKRVLFSRDIDLSSPLWPVVRVWPKSFTGAGVQVEVQSGQKFEMTQEVVRLLRSVLQEK